MKHHLVHEVYFATVHEVYVLMMAKLAKSAKGRTSGYDGAVALPHKGSACA
jgi:hypothetical protein